MVKLQTEPIVVDELLDAVRCPEAGAVATFLGTVRIDNDDRRVLRLEYHAYEGMARSEMERLHRETLERFEISRLAVVHRTGTLEVGEASVCIAVSAPHRGPALDACRHVIDSLKKSVPIWKKEFFEGGEVWIEGKVPEGA